jgi:hypothetical protein
MMFRSLRNWLNFKVIFGAIAFALCVFAIFLGILWSAKADTIPMAPATALLNIIEAPTETLPAPASTMTPTMNPSASQGVPLPSGEIDIGDYVQVSGTGGDGLRLHETAGVSGKVQYIAIDTEVFLVKEGPIDADGYIWWLLQDPYTENAVGWGVANYLSVVQNP